MRTHRITLLVSKAEKERIAREAAFLGTGTDEYVRKAALLLDAEDIIGMEDVRSLLPELRAALDRMDHRPFAGLTRIMQLDRCRTAEAGGRVDRRARHGP